MSSHPPPSAVLRAFGVEGSPRPLAGGQGSSWVADGLVFKPEGGALHEWLSEVIGDLAAETVRLASPVRTRDGAWTVDGWSATRWVEGREPDRSAPATWIEILEAGRAFHRSVAPLTRPGWLDARRDWWALADRAVWGERTVRFLPEFAALARRLRNALRPLGRSQVVHGDLTGNVLFHPGLPPAVIDISPYWRPPEYAEGIVVADALCWHGAQASLLELAGVSVPAVARALLFRMATTSERGGPVATGADLHDEAQRYDRAITAIGL